jgi:hypothetical protein
MKKFILLSPKGLCAMYYKKCTIRVVEELARMTFQGQILLTWLNHAQSFCLAHK